MSKNRHKKSLRCVNKRRKKGHTNKQRPSLSSRLHSHLHRNEKIYIELCSIIVALSIIITLVVFKQSQEEIETIFNASEYFWEYGSYYVIAYNSMKNIFKALTGI